jgi:SPOR domain
MTALPTPPEPEELPPLLSAERPVRSDYARRPGLSYAARRVITVCVLLAVIGGIVTWVVSHSKPSGPAEIPTIKSEGAYKQRPAQPGGIDIPHQDVQVYHELEANSDAAKPPVEHLLPQSETPQQTPASAPAMPPSPKLPQMESLLGAPAPKIETTVTPEPPPPAASLVKDVTPAPTPAPAPSPAPITAAPVSPPSAPTPAVVTPAPRPAKPTASVSTTVPVIDMTKQVNAAPAKPTATTPAAKAKKDSAVQLASVPDQINAYHMMDELQSKWASELGSYHLRLVKADLGAKGTYYRVQSSAMTKDQAEKICATLKKSKAGCIIVHP